MSEVCIVEFIPYLEVVSQICISDLPRKYQQTTRWHLFNRLCYRHYKTPKRHECACILLTTATSVNYDCICEKNLWDTDLDSLSPRKWVSKKNSASHEERKKSQSFQSNHNEAATWKLHFSRQNGAKEKIKVVIGFFEVWLWHIVFNSFGRFNLK